MQSVYHCWFNVGIIRWWDFKSFLRIIAFVTTKVAVVTTKGNNNKRKTFFIFLKGKKKNRLKKPFHKPRKELT
ncbi:MAG: hypothetical protein JZD40_06820 [Sulfolobus sp.]|nr:hypothetical protein [Sulfolobus sp.]